MTPLWAHLLTPASPCSAVAALQSSRVPLLAFAQDRGQAGKFVSCSVANTLQFERLKSVADLSEAPRSSSSWLQWAAVSSKCTTAAAAAARARIWL